MEIDRLLLYPAIYYRPCYSDMPVSLTACLCLKMYKSVEHDLCPTCYERLERPLLLSRRGGRPRQVLLYNPIQSVENRLNKSYTF